VQFLAAVLTAHLARNTEQITILDWGCGKGHISYLLRKHGFNVMSCDRAGKADDSAFGQATPIIQEANISVVPLTDDVALPFADASFDCVVSFGVLEHVPADLASLREIRRVLKADGLLYITFLPYFLSWTQAVARVMGNTYHDRLYRSDGVRRIAAEARFSVRALWHAQLFPKNTVPLRFDPVLERVDRFLCAHTPLKYFATNVEALLSPV
jgi:SAM-dependent methyltransferase